ncbi:MAG: hypothetical protein ACYDHH_16090 [Solirubrobacteraceae bacterium]
MESPGQPEQNPTEQTVVEMLRVARERDVAPAGLHARIHAMHESPAPRPVWRARGALSGAVAGAVAVAATLIVLLAPSGTPGAPTLAQAAALAGRAPTAAAPVPVSSDPARRLNASIGEVYFPNWEKALHWRAVGERVDQLRGRRTVTVFYAWKGHEIAYTIVSAPALRQPSVPSVTMHGVVLRTLRIDGRLVTTWRRGGSTCVLSGRDVPARLLESLASWSA